MTRPPTTTEADEALGLEIDAALGRIDAVIGRIGRTSSSWLGRQPLTSPPTDRLLTSAETTRKPRKPTLASVAKQASKAAIAVARYEVKPDGTVVIVTGAPERVETEDPWPLDEFRTKETKQ